MITTFLVPIHSQFSHMHFECELALHFMQYAYIISGHYPEILEVRESLFVNAKSSFLAKLWLTQPCESTTLKYFKA